MILGMSVGAFTIFHVAITLVAIGSGLIVVGGTPLGLAELVISVLILLLWRAGM